MRERKFYAERVRRYVDKIERVLYDAYLKVDEEREEKGLGHPAPEDIDVLSWPQTWPDARCGFDKPLRDVYPTEQTNVVLDARLGVALVYHAGQFARRESPYRVRPLGIDRRIRGGILNAFGSDKRS
mgnify:CR=1 FL=1